MASSDYSVPRHPADFRPLGVGDLVRVLRACRLPTEDVLGVGVIHQVTRASSGESLYWVRGFECARTARELRRTRTLAEQWAEQDDDNGGTVTCLDCGWPVRHGEPCGRCGLGVNE